MGKLTFEELDLIGNRAEIERLAFTTNRWNKDNVEVVRTWLKREDAKSAAAALERAEGREQDAISIAREANTIALAAAVSASDANAIARSARKISFIAAIAAIVAAIATVIAAK